MTSNQHSSRHQEALMIAKRVLAHKRRYREREITLSAAVVDLVEQLEAARERLNLAVSFIAYQDMSYRFAEWCDENANPTSEPLVIDADEFEEAKNNPEWREFCERADEYVSDPASEPKS